MKISQKNQVLL